jgi:hypothetical protein
MLYRVSQSRELGDVSIVSKTLKIIIESKWGVSKLIRYVRKLTADRDVQRGEWAVVG